MSIRSATRWTAAALSVAWLVTILPALPPPLGAQGGGSRRLRVRKVVGATLERARANPGRYLILLAVLSLAPVATRLIDALAGRTGLSVLLIVLMEATLAIPTGMLSYSIGLS